METLTDAAVSVNAWSDAPAFKTLHAIYSLPVPLESSWEFPMLVEGAAAYIQLVVDSALARAKEPAAATTFVARLRQRRWDAIVASEEIRLQNDASHANVAAGIKTACRRRAERSWSAGALNESVMNKFAMQSKEAAVLFQSIADQGVLELCLGNFVEQVALIALGVEWVYPFFQECFQDE